MEEVLTHVHDDCIGSWRLIGTGEHRQICCERCDARVPATPENRLAAIDENYAGIYLRRLTTEGIAYLRTDQ